MDHPEARDSRTEMIESLQARNSELADRLQETELACFRLQEKSGLDGPIQEAVVTAKQASGEASQGLGQLERGVHELTDETDKIQTILKEVEKISNQTGLLSLNARIESSRAGVHGEGFGVVAEEVKILAARTRETIQGVSDVVRAITDRSVKSLLLIESFKENLVRIEASVQTLHEHHEELVTSVRSRPPGEQGEELDLELF